MRALLLSFILLATSGLAQARTILMLGDSISAGYGLEKLEQGWVSLLQEKVRPRGITVANASISGETSAGGLGRLGGLLARHRPEIVILELGANDGLRGLPTQQLESNLGTAIRGAQEAGAKVLLLGMKIPPNYGKRYTDRFEKVYPDLARHHGIVLVPFLLDGVGGNDGLMQPDRIHPNQAAQAILLDRVWDKLGPMLER